MPKDSFNKKTTSMMLVINAIILIATAVTAITGILYGASSSQDGDNMIGLGYFQAFTMDINILAGICALFVVCFALRSLLKREYTMPEWVNIFHFTTAVDLLLTFVTVVFFLAPMDMIDGKSYLGMFSNDLFLFHLINPLLSVLSFVFLQKKNSFKRKDCLWGELPLIIYIIVYFMMVVVFKKWSDFYNFSLGGNYWLIPAVIIFMLFLTYLLGRLLIWMNNKVQTKQ